jgi:hypothetical protein
MEALGGVSGQLCALAALNPRGKDPSTHRTGDWVGPGDGLDTEVRGKILLPLIRIITVCIFIQLHTNSHVTRNSVVTDPRETDVEFRFVTKLSITFSYPLHCSIVIYFHTRSRTCVKNVSFWIEACFRETIVWFVCRLISP